MTDTGQEISTENLAQNKAVHPTKDRIGHYKHLIKERFPDAEKVIKKFGKNPLTPEGRKMRIHIAADKLRDELKSDNDPLTGLLNLQGYRKRQEQESIRAKTYQHPLSIASVDVNDLKETNDRLGHHAGDLLLQNIGKALRLASGETNVIARIGGDECRVLLPEKDLEAAKAWKEKALQIMDHMQISASIGVARVNGFDQHEIEESLREADAKMYEDKRKYKESKKPKKIKTKFLEPFRKISALLRRK